MVHSYIYLIQVCKHIGTKKYKIGKTTPATDSRKIDRFMSYPKGSEPHLLRSVPTDQVTIIEDMIIDVFNKRFELFEGREWFIGDKKEMIKIIETIIEENITDKHIKDNNTVKEQGDIGDGGNDSKKIFKCNNCDYSTNRKDTLNRHINSKICLRKQETHSCHDCKTKPFATKSSLNRHLKTKKHFDRIKINNSKNVIVGSDNSIVDNSHNSHVVINTFLDNDLSFLCVDDIYYVLNKQLSALYDLIIRTNFNGKKTDSKKWILTDINVIIDELLAKKIDDIEEIIEKYKSQVPEKVIEKVLEAIDTAKYKRNKIKDDCDKIEAKKLMVRNLKLLLYNYRDVVLNTTK